MPRRTPDDWSLMFMDVPENEGWIENDPYDTGIAAFAEAVRKEAFNEAIAVAKTQIEPDDPMLLQGGVQCAIDRIIELRDGEIDAHPDT